ncbi:DNA-binding transcriptional regulator HexR [compost metagenome]
MIHHLYNDTFAIPITLDAGEHMNTFHGIEQAIYEFIINNSKNLINISAKEIAAHALSTTTSVNRVCKKMGYQSYTEARYKLESDLHRDRAPKSMHDESPEQLKQLIQSLKNTQLVYLYGCGASMVSIQYLSRFLSLSNIPHLALNDIHQLAKANHGCALFLSKSGETDSVISMARNAKRKGLKVSAITLKNSTLNQVAHITVPLNQQVDGNSLYSRESQISMLNQIDRLGKLLLED